MSEEESTTPDPVRLARRGSEAMSRGDLDAVMSLFAADAVDYASAGNGLTLAVILQEAHVVGSSGSVLRYASVAEWIDGLIVRDTTYTDIDEAGADAERLAQG
jgi:hypothetical protein